MHQTTVQDGAEAAKAPFTLGDLAGLPAQGTCQAFLGSWWRGRQAKLATAGCVSGAGQGFRLLPTGADAISAQAQMRRHESRRLATQRATARHRRIC